MFPQGKLENVDDGQRCLGQQMMAALNFTSVLA